VSRLTVRRTIELELSDDEYVEVQNVLRRAAVRSTVDLDVDEKEALTIEHLRTNLAQAMVATDDKRRNEMEETIYVETMGEGDFAVAEIIDTAKANVGDPHWKIEYWNTGGGCMCIVADHPALPICEGGGEDETDLVYVGDASGEIGWSNYYGDRFGDFDPASTAEETGEALAALLDGYLARNELPNPYEGGAK